MPNNTNSNWEPESIELFDKMTLGRFPLNRAIKDALDSIVKLSKQPCSIEVEGNGTDTVTSDSLSNRLVAIAIVDDIPKTTGFTKTGATDSQKLASSSIQFTDGTIPADGSKIIFVFK